MLKFPCSFVTDDKAESAIEANINALLLDIISFPMEHFADEYNTDMQFVEFVDNNREAFGRYINHTYDLQYEPLETFRVYAGLCCLLVSENKYVPTLRMERLLAHLIINAIETNKMMKAEGFDPAYEMKLRSFNKMTVLNALMHEWNSMDPEEKETMQAPGIAIRRYELPDDFLEMCFWDDDWSFIDEYEKIDLPEHWWEEEYRGEPRD